MGESSALMARSDCGLAGKSWPEFVATGLVYYCLTSAIAVLGVVVGQDFVRPAGRVQSQPGDLIDAFARVDGLHYMQIADSGYSYDSAKRSNVAFFPAFPMAGRIVTDLFGCRTELALLLVAHFALAAAFVVLAAYLHERWPSAPPSQVSMTMLAFGLFPTTFFFRMAYSESPFVLATLVVLYGIERRWSPLLLAMLAGAATGIRPVGIALLPPVALAVWKQSPSVNRGLLNLAWVLPLGCWSLAAYMVFQAVEFGDALAFARTQAHWRLRPAVPLAEQAESLAAWEPLWAVFDPASPCYWQKHERLPNAFFSLRFANPLYFVLAVFLVCGGVWRGWLNYSEVLTGTFLLAMPYVTRSHEMCCCSMGRFTAVAIPSYLVMGQILGRIPPGVAGGMLAISGFVMGVYAALFAAGYPLI